METNNKKDIARIIAEIKTDKKEIDNNFDIPQTKEPIRKLHLEEEPLGKLIFKDEQILKQICDCLVAQKMYRRFRSPQTNIDISISPIEYVMNYLSSTPISAKWLQSIQPETTEKQDEFEIEWSPGKYLNFDQLALILASIVSIKLNVKKLISCVRIQHVDTLIYPGLPLRIYGQIITEKDILKNNIILHNEDNEKLKIIFNTTHDISWIEKLYKKRNLFVLGIVKNIFTEIEIIAGAIMF